MSEGQEDRFEEVFAGLATLAEDKPGCERVSLHRPVDADCYVIQAVWTSFEAFDRWRTSEAFQTAHEGIPDELFAGPNQLEIHEQVR